MGQYTNYDNLFNNYTFLEPSAFNALSETEQDKYLYDLISEIRKINELPIYHYDRDGIVKEIQKCFDCNVELQGNVLNLRQNAGINLCNFLFPNLHKVDCRNQKNNSMYDRFFDDRKLYRTLKFISKNEKLNTPYRIYSASRLIDGAVATNFAPMRAKVIYEKYCKDGAVIHDYCCGFGGRMLGALTSHNNYKYIGTDPCTETYNSLIKLGNYIEEVSGRKDSFDIRKTGSQYKVFEDDIADFSFSSPPYFMFERYSDEETQCYNEFPTMDEWFDGFVVPTIKNSIAYLKHDGLYAVNIGDFKISGKPYYIVDRWLDICNKLGMKEIETITFKIPNRRGDGHKSLTKEDSIYVFEKADAK